MKRTTLCMLLIYFLFAISLIFMVYICTGATADVLNLTWLGPTAYNLNFQQGFRIPSSAVSLQGLYNHSVNSGSAWFNQYQYPSLRQPWALQQGGFMGSIPYQSSMSSFVLQQGGTGGYLPQNALSLASLGTSRTGYAYTAHTMGSYSTGMFMLGTGLGSLYSLYSPGYSTYYPWEVKTCPCSVKEPTKPCETTGLMLLIEFDGTEGLNNFAFELQKREIPSLLIVTAEFVAANCENIRRLQKYGVEIGGVCPQKPFWDVPYEEQYEAMRATKETIEACTGKPMQVFGSRYFAYDENTIKAAESLGISYVLARGTTGAKATIYQPEEYNVKIFSVSNVSSPSWGTGSLCDYSYWAREGSPEEFGEQLFDAAANNSKISPVSHTYIGGLKAAWNAEYLNFFDTAGVTWVDLDEFGCVDVIKPFAQIPDNREVQYETPKPLTPLDQEPNVNNPCSIDDFPPAATEGLMLLIEYEGTEGLTNFVFELQKRNISSILLTAPSFVSDHCDTIRTLLDYGMEVVALTGPQLWGVPYEEQFATIKAAKDTIEACTGRPLRIVTSRYMASDENTWRVAEELGIPYVLARGTTGTRATVYQPAGYNVKVIAVSNMDTEQWAYGSLCDYSIWARGGTPQDFSAELYDAALSHDRICTVSHTRISGLKAAWYSVYMEFLDHSGVKYLGMDDFTTVDFTLPIDEIPQNRNVPYAAQPYPAVPLDEEPNVNNPCAIEDFPPVSGSDGDVGEKIVVFHNGTGPMCLQFFEFADTITYPVEAHLTSESDFWTTLNGLKEEFGSSEGMSNSFGYFPIIFIQNRAFSGFNDTIKETILGII